ncbi:MAG: DnaA N-terminal domain-containing protein, partial [Thermosynechococcaceae cyanobacterium]
MDNAIESFWNQVLERLQLQLSRPTFETWIKTASAESLEDGRLTIQTPNPFAKNWLQKYYMKAIAEAVQDILGYPVEIRIEIRQGEAESGSILSDPSMAMPSSQSQATTPMLSQRSRGGDLNPKYAFSRYVV